MSERIESTTFYPFTHNEYIFYHILPQKKTTNKNKHKQPQTTTPAQTGLCVVGEEKEEERIT